MPRNDSAAAGGSFWGAEASGDKRLPQTRQGLLKSDCGLHGGSGSIGPLVSGRQLHPRSQGLPSWPWRSACQHWRPVNQAFIVDLPDKKVRLVGARDEPGAPVARIDQYAIRARARPGGQDGRANNCPVEPSPACILAPPCRRKSAQGSGRNRVVEESSTATAVAGSAASDADQAPNRARLHRINEDASSDGNRRVPLKIISRVGETPSV
jgi:hypothetical protein